MTLPAAGQYTFSVWVKLVSGTPLNSPVQYSGLGVNVFMNALPTSTWTRVYGTVTVPSAGAFTLVHPFYDSVATIDYAQVQIETGDIATDYIATTSAAVSVGPVANVPRLDYLNSSCPRLLLEPQRTNTITFSEDVTSCLTSQVGTTVTANATASPDGYQSADLVAFTASSYRLRNQTVAAATTYTMSVFFKNNTFSGTEFIAFNMSDGVIGGMQAQIQPANGTATFSGSAGAWTGVSGKVENYGNGWYRVSVTGTSVSGGSGWYEVASILPTKSAYFWGFSLEIGAYATSYIPTLGAAVTRGADFSQKSSISGLFGATATTFVLDFVKKANATGWTITGSNGTKLFSLCQFDNTGGIPRVVFDDGVDTSSTLAALSNGRHKIAVSYTTNDTRIYIDGALVLTDTACTYYQMDRIGVNATAWTGYTNNTNAFEINQFLMIPAATSNADLAALTA